MLILKVFVSKKSGKLVKGLFARGISDYLLTFDQKTVLIVCNMTYSDYYDLKEGTYSVDPGLGYKLIDTAK